jgi:hypothetical protein
VDDPGEVPPDATRFDMRGAELGHHGGDCTFETILRRYDLDDPVLCDLARIVHEADLEDIATTPPRRPRRHLPGPVDGPEVLSVTAAGTTGCTSTAAGPSQSIGQVGPAHDTDPRADSV